MPIVLILVGIIIASVVIYLSVTRRKRRKIIVQQRMHDKVHIRFKRSNRSKKGGSY